jgi:ATP-dependent protease HslVU (ClpYQ) peptidase subunit
MTTIAYKDGIMAADTSSVGNGVFSSRSRKIFLNEEYCVAGAGAPEAARRFLKKQETGEVYDGEKDNLLIYDFNNNLLLGQDKGKWTYNLDGDTPVSFGTGREIALGAMDHGASAIEAVKIAGKRCIYTNDEVIAYNCLERKWIHEFK